VPFVGIAGLLYLQQRSRDTLTPHVFYSIIDYAVVVEAWSKPGDTGTGRGAFTPRIIL
jgi:hypothetical protein